MYLDRGYRLGMLQMRCSQNTTPNASYIVEWYSSDPQSLKNSFGGQHVIIVQILWKTVVYFDTGEGLFSLFRITEHQLLLQ